MSTARPLPSTRRRPVTRHRPGPWRSFARAVSWHRRKLAIVAAVVAVLAAISAAAPSAPPTVAVVRLVRELPGGAVVTASDLRVDQVQSADVPTGAFTDVGPVVGQTLTGPAAKGQMLTPLALSSGQAGLRPGHVVAPLRLADSGMADLLHPGDVVDVVAADGQAAKASVVAAAVRVITVPHPPDDDGSDSAGALVLLDVDRATATVLARAAVSATLTVVWR